MDQSQLDALYQQYLGRGVDPSGAATWGNADYNTVVQGILGSQEYQQRQQQSQPQQSAPSNQEPPPSWLLPADYAANGYAAPYTQQQITSKVDPSWIRQMNGQTYASVKGPSDLSGGEYLVDTKTGKFALDKNGNPIGVTYPKSNGFDDWATTPLGGLALTFGVPLAAAGGIAALEGLGAIGGGAGALETTGAGGLAGGGAFTPAAGSGASFGITPGAAYTTAGGLAAGDGAWGLSSELAKELGLDYSTSGLTDLSGEAGSRLLEELGLNTGMSLPSWLSPSALSTLAKGGTALSSVAKALGLTGTTGTKTGGASGSTDALANALRNIAGANTAQAGTNFGLMKGNVNPFTYAKDVPVQTVATNKTDPFAALNVAQTPVQPINPLAHLFG